MAKDGIKTETARKDGHFKTTNNYMALHPKNDIETTKAKLLDLPEQFVGHPQKAKAYHVGGYVLKYNANNKCCQLWSWGELITDFIVFQDAYNWAEINEIEE